MQLLLWLAVADAVSDAVLLGDREADRERLPVGLDDTDLVTVKEGVQETLDAVPLALAVWLRVQLKEGESLRLPDLVRLPVSVFELVLEHVPLPDSLEVNVKLRLELPVSDTEGLPVRVCVVLKVACNVLDVVRDAEIVSEPVPDKVLVALQLMLLEMLCVRLIVAVERVWVSLPLPLADADRVPESVALRLSDTVCDRVAVPEAERVVPRLPDKVTEGLLVELRVPDVLGDAEWLSEALPEPVAVLEYVFVQLAEGVLVHVPDPDAENDCVDEALAVALGLKVQDPVQLPLRDREHEHDGVEVADREPLEVADAVALPDLDIEALVRVPELDSERVQVGDALAESEAVRLKLPLPLIVRETDPDLVSVALPVEDTLQLRLRLWVTLLTEELKESDRVNVLLPLSDGLKVVLRLWLRVHVADGDRVTLRVELSVKLSETLPERLEVAVTVVPCALVAEAVRVKVQE